MAFSSSGVDLPEAILSKRSVGYEPISWLVTSKAAENKASPGMRLTDVEGSPTRAIASMAVHDSHVLEPNLQDLSLPVQEYNQ